MCVYEYILSSLDSKPACFGARSIEQNPAYTRVMGFKGWKRATSHLNSSDAQWAEKSKFHTCAANYGSCNASIFVPFVA